MHIRRRFSAAFALLGLLILPSIASANLVIQTPPGLNPGDRFRVIFVTDGVHDAVSSSIATYNTFVNSDASAQAGGTVTYLGTVLNFQAIGSTSTVSAIQNVGTTGAPVYLASGTLVATGDGTGTGELFGTYFGSVPMAHAINQDLLGNPFNTLVWTGSASSGQVIPPGSGDPLGPAVVFGSQPGFGVTSESTYQAIGAGGGAGYASGQKPFYGISQVLTVPEPTTVACVGLIAVVLVRRTRHQCLDGRQIAAGRLLQ